MRKRNVIITLLFILTSIHVAKAQIGYQVSLLNTATGEARANETVTVTVSLSNSAGEIFYSETKQSTTNDFGVLSLTVGNADTFKDVDLTKMPFYIEVTANGVMIGKSQMLSVPVAEVAKQVAPIDKSLIVGTIWKKGSLYTLTFKEDGKVTYSSGDNIYGEYHYVVDGTFIYLYNDDNVEYQPGELRWVFKYCNGRLIAFDDEGYWKK